MGYRLAAIACASTLAICAMPAVAQERYADFRFSVEVTGMHSTRNRVGDSETTNKSRRFDGHARLRYLGPADTVMVQPSVTRRPAAPTTPMGAGGGDYIAKMMACQQKSSSDAEAEACMIEVATAGPAGARIKRCLAKSETDRNKDPMCSGGGGGASADDAPQASRRPAQTEMWSSVDCEGNLLVNDTGSQHAVADTTPGGGPIDSVTSVTGAWSGSTKRNGPGGGSCAATVIINHATGQVDVTLEPGPTRIPVVRKFDSLTTKTSINPFDWSAVEMNAGTLVIKKAARNGSARQFSGSWTKSGGAPRELKGQQSTDNNRFSTSTSARWSFAAQ